MNDQVKEEIFKTDSTFQPLLGLLTLTYLL